MTAISSDQQTLAPISTFTSQVSAPLTRSGQQSASSFHACATRAYQESDQLRLTPEAAQELRELKQRDREVRAYEKADSEALPLVRPDTLNRENGSPRTSSQASVSSSPQNQGAGATRGQHEKTYVFKPFEASDASLSKEQEEQPTKISWANGTYHVGRSAAQHRFYFSAQASMSGDNAVPAQGPSLRHAQRSYTSMARQGYFPTDIVPHGIGISLRV